METSKNTWTAALLVLGTLSCLSSTNSVLMQQCGAEPASATKIADSKQPTKVKEEGKEMPIYEFKAKALDGSEVNFDKYKGDVLLIVNTASKCGYTPQYTGLEELHKKFAEKGLKVLGFPCNQFGAQEPGDSTEIGSFCKKNYGVEFQMFEKVDVNGAEAHPLYKFLTATSGETHPIKWNFTKFLVDRKGNILKRYEPATKPEEIAADIEKQI
jgi:glutathione peroxidase